MALLGPDNVRFAFMKIQLFRFKKLCVAVLLIWMGLPAHSEVQWIFEVGGMYTTKSDFKVIRDEFLDGHSSWTESKDPTFNAIVGLGLVIPVSHKIPLSIETGLRYRRAWMETNYVADEKITEDRLRKTLYTGDDWGNMIEVPIKLNYHLSTSEICGFDFAIGPRIAYNFTPLRAWQQGYKEYEIINGEVQPEPFNISHLVFPEWKYPVTIDLEPSITFNIKAFRVGIQGTIPVYNPSHYTNKTWASVTIGVSFNSGVWGKIGQGALVAGQVMTTVAEG